MQLAILFASSVFAAALIAGGEIATPSSAAELFTGRCHMNHCWWFSIEEKELIASNERGALFKATIKIWESEHPDGNYETKARRTGGEATLIYFFCSKQSPAVIWEAGGVFEGIIIDPYNVAGATEGATSQYFAACHGVHYSEQIDPGKKFGYERSYGDLTELKLVRPEEVLGAN